MKVVEMLPEEEKCLKNLERELSIPNKMSQIYITSGSDKLNGKIVDKISFYDSKCDYDENHLVIKFTDGTYILITIENDEGKICFGQHLPKAEHFSPESLGYIVNDSFKYNKCYQQLIDIGVLNYIPEETLQEAILEHKRKQEFYEYMRYKELEAKYKDYNPTETVN